MGLLGWSGKLGRVDDADVVLLDAAGDPDLLVALQQRIVEFAVGIGVALVDIVLDAALAKVGEIALQRVDPAREHALALDGRLDNLAASEVPIRASSLRDRRVQRLDLRLQRLRRRVVRLELLQQLVILRLAPPARCSRIRAMASFPSAPLLASGLPVSRLWACIRSAVAMASALLSATRSSLTSERSPPDGAASLPALEAWAEG